MKQFEYTIQDPLGIHARPAGLLAKEAKQFGSVCTITKGDQTIKLSQLMQLLAMGIQQGDIVRVQAEGADEEAAISALQAFFQKNL